MSAPISPGRMNEYRKGGTKPPDKRGIYRIRRANGDIMYIGISEHLRKRMNDHISTGNFLIDDGEYFQYKVAKDDAEYDDMRELERSWINKYNPPRNKRRGGGGRPPKGIQSENNSKCYITTAVCEEFGKPDDCEELTQLRMFRDTWLAKQPDGPALIAQYYQTSPDIVQCIDADADRSRLYQSLYKDYISECLTDLSRGDYEGCKARYIVMTQMLMKKYGFPTKGTTQV